MTNSVFNLGREQVDFAAEKLNSHKLGWFKVGQVVPVRYRAWSGPS
jgi:hypothetical protein